MRSKVPEILKPNPKSIISLASIEQQNEMSLAYKHPLVVKEELVDNFPNKYCDAPSISVDNSSIIVAKTRKMLGYGAMGNQDRPRLIGKINPNILKTWEQLSNNMEDDLQNRRVCNRGIQDEQDDQQSCVLFIRKPHNFSQSEDEKKFMVNKYNHEVGSSGDGERFYDSIDEFAIGGLSDEETIDFSAGDRMADIDSLELK